MENIHDIEITNEDMQDFDTDNEENEENIKYICTVDQLVIARNILENMKEYCKINCLYEIIDNLTIKELTTFLERYGYEFTL